MKKSEVQNDSKPPEANDTDIQEKLKKVEMKATSPTTLLARNTVLLPSGVARVKQLHQVKPVDTSSSGSATGNPRNKTALAPGHSLMDWIRLGNSGVDLTGVGGVPRIVSMSELAVHNKQNDAWIAIRGIVFNVTRYMDFHPGGVEELMRGVGKDATKLFDNVHAWVNYQSILQKCVVGRLSRTSGAASLPPPPSIVPEKPATKSSSTLSLIKSCTAAPSTDEQKSSDADVLNISMDWRQTTNSITLFYKRVQTYPAMYYQLERIGDAKLLFKLTFSKDIVKHEVLLHADVEWPPVCTRNFDTMEIDFTFAKKTKELWKTHGCQTLSKERRATKRTYRNYEVLANVAISKLVNLLVLRAKDFLQVIPIGRHLEAKMTVMGMEVSRSYTPVPPCLHPDVLAPNYKSDCICLMIKRYPDGALSPSITALEPGESVALSDVLGSFVAESFDRYSVIHMLAGGTGLTALLGIVQRGLARRSVRSINLLNFNKDEDNMFYVEQLEKASGDKLKVTHILSEGGGDWPGRRGKLSHDLLKELIAESSSDACVFTCGPPGFIQTAKKSLQSLGWKSEQTFEFDE